MGLDQTLRKLNFVKSSDSGVNLGFSQLNFPKVMISQVIVSSSSRLNTAFPSYILLEVPPYDKLQVTLCRLYFPRLHIAHKKLDRGIKYKTLSSQLISSCSVFTLSVTAYITVIAYDIRQNEMSRWFDNTKEFLSRLRKLFSEMNK